MTKKRTNKRGNEAKLFQSLQKGVIWSRKQIQHTFKLNNPSAAILRLEDKNIPIIRQYFYDSKKHITTVKYAIV